jgi:hypothetical protein
MAEDVTEAELDLRRRKEAFHRSQAELPIVEKLKIMDELQSTALIFTHARRITEGR